MFGGFIARIEVEVPVFLFNIGSVLFFVFFLLELIFLEIWKNINKMIIFLLDFLFYLSLLKI